MITAWMRTTILKWFSKCSNGGPGPFLSGDDVEKEKIFLKNNKIKNLQNHKTSFNKIWHSCEGNSSFLQIRSLYLRYDVITTFFKFDFRMDLYIWWAIWSFCFTRTRGYFQFLNCGGVFGLVFFVFVSFYAPFFLKQSDNDYTCNLNKSPK